MAGQDGSSRGGARPEARSQRPEGALRCARWRVIDAAEPAVNVASMIGLGSVRGRVVGDERPAGDA